MLRVQTEISGSQARSAVQCHVAYRNKETGLQPVPLNVALVSFFFCASYSLLADIR